jgi:hypothetical protein
MSLSAPKQVTFIISVVLAVLAILATIVPLGFITGMAFWILALGFLVLALGCLLPDL